VVRFEASELTRRLKKGCCSLVAQGNHGGPSRGWPGGSALQPLQNSGYISTAATGYM
jgi:hypothetical protein